MIISGIFLGGKDSPLFDKARWLFSSVLYRRAETRAEEKGAYYNYEQEEICDKILDEFGNLTGMHRHIINGHVPVRSNQGSENPIKANGKMLVIDGGSPVRIIWKPASRATYISISLPWFPACTNTNPSELGESDRGRL